MLIGLMTVVGVGCAQNGGVIETLHIASEGGRLEMFNMSLSPFVRYTFLNTIANGFFFQLRMYSSEQVNIQRICAVKSVKNARRVLKDNIYGQLFMYVLTFSCGLVAYSTYAGCDPMALGLIKKKDQILPYFVIDKLRVRSRTSWIVHSYNHWRSFKQPCPRHQLLRGNDVERHLPKICLFQKFSDGYATIINKILCTYNNNNNNNNNN
ncbi:Sodium-coupled monocarboxylate transporter 2, partial [Armadillidium vulgare]